jgi:hypothetical protein
MDSAVITRRQRHEFPPRRLALQNYVRHRRKAPHSRLPACAAIRLLLPRRSTMQIFKVPENEAQHTARL